MYGSISSLLLKRSTHPLYATLQTLREYDTTLSFLIMSGAPRLFASPLLGVIAAVAAFIAALIYTAELPRVPIVLGFWRQNAKTVVADPQDFHFLSDTVHCEDLHYHESSNLLFTACEGTEHTRQAWFPALGLLGNPTTGLRAQGALEVIDPHVRLDVTEEKQEGHGSSTDTGGSPSVMKQVAA